MTWDVVWALEITISPDVGSVGSSGLTTGNIVVSPTQTTTYTLTATSSYSFWSHSVTEDVTITVLKKEGFLY